MKIKLIDGFYYLTASGGEVSAPENRADWLHPFYVHALVRLGMEAQQRRDAGLISEFGLKTLETPQEIEMRQQLAHRLRAQPIELADIEAAIGEGE